MLESLNFPFCKKVKMCNNDQQTPDVNFRKDGTAEVKVIIMGLGLSSNVIKLATGTGTLYGLMQKQLF